MKLNDYLEGLRAAQTAAELDLALCASFKHSFSGRTWATIRKTRLEHGLAICDKHQHGLLVPRLDGRLLTVCGESYRVGRGMNSTGARYVWHSAGEFAKGVLLRNGLSRRAASRIWGSCSDYPHRCLPIIDEALSGRLPDPPMNKLIFSHISHSPVTQTVEANDADKSDRRATRPCGCGGTRFDWGSGFSDDLTFISWHCNGCRRVYIEYVSNARLAEIRTPPHAVHTNPSNHGTNGSTRKCEQP